jgi:diguanylate cyclase (GGDEF)-like protein
MRNQAGYPVRLAILCALYFGAAKAGLAFAFANKSVTSIWPPTGIALAATIVWGYRMWPAIAAGAFLANITTAGPVLGVAAIAGGNTLEAVVGAFLLRRVAGFEPSLERVRDVLALVAYAGLVSTAICATAGVSSLSLAGLVPHGQVLSTWRVWWFGDLGGDLVVAPALLVFASRPAFERRPWVGVEAVGLLAALVATSAVAFSSRVSFAYVVIPLLLWIAFRFRQPGIAIASLIVSGIAVWSTAHGNGPFIGGSEDAELLRAQTYVGVAAVTGLVAAALITERRQAEQLLRQLANHDPLTGLFNRRRFAEELERWIGQSARYGGLGAVLVVDVDHFKRINDEFGHSVGDQALARLATLLRKRVRSTDIVARLGGDEFTVLLPHANEEEALALTTALRDELSNESLLLGAHRSVRVTISIGVSQFGQGVDLDPKRVLANADAAMYEAKEAGRDTVRIHRASGASAGTAGPNGTPALD